MIARITISKTFNVRMTALKRGSVAGMEGVSRVSELSRLANLGILLSYPKWLEISTLLKACYGWNANDNFFHFSTLPCVLEGHFRSIGWTMENDERERRILGLVLDLRDRIGG